MNKKRKIILYSVLLCLGLISFILEIFVFQKPDEILGLAICIFSIYLILGSIFKLCKLSKLFSNTFIEMLDLLFWIP